MRAIDSPKKQTNEFVCFCCEELKKQKTNCLFDYWENLRHADLLTVLSDFYPSKNAGSLKSENDSSSEMIRSLCCISHLAT